MKSYFWLIISFVLLFHFSCVKNEEPKGIEETFWVYSYLVPCDGTLNGIATCFRISNIEEWDKPFFYNSQIVDWVIDGFVFKPNYIQRLQVRKYLDPKSGEFKRKLVKVITEERDYFDLVEGGWKVNRYMGKDLPNSSFPNGQKVNFMPISRLVSSFDGCYKMTYAIQEVYPNKIPTIGFLIWPNIGCPSSPQNIPFPGMENNFKREGNILTFFSEADGEIAVWEKVN